MDKEKMNNDPQNTSEEITERIEEMIEEETETGAGTVSISDRLREAEADENDYDADVEDGYDEAEYDEADGEVDGENEYGEASEDAEYVEDEYNEEEEEEEDDDDEPRIVVNPKVVKVASLILFSGIILVFASIAWFTMNRDVSSGGMSITTTTLPFDIATKGANIRYSNIISDKKPEYEEGTSGTLVNTAGASGSYYKADSLLLRYDTGESEIGPGGYGSLSLYIIPRINDAQTVKVSLNVVSFVEIEKKAANGDYIYKKDGNNNTVLDTNGNPVVDTVIVEVTTVNALKTALLANDASISNADAQENSEKSVVAAKYIQGHIMFFGAEGTAFGITDSSTDEEKAAAYYYATPYTDRTITQTIVAGNKDKAVQVPIFWMWPNTLGQIALPDNSSGQRGGYPILQDTDSTGKARVKSYLLSQGENIFDNYTTISSSYNGYIDTVTGAYNSSTFSTAFNSLSSGYNKADNMIGTGISYFLIEVKVEPDSGS
ncbi:MAG: hypothetical protein IKQ63_06295 [Eubacterium sp.]|nr:hypothetical protein [Eubacterium sp.]